MPKNVILIIADSARPDHLSCYGYARNTSPNVDWLATKGARFENVLSPSVWTPPSHLSLFSGLYPSEHDITTYHEGKNLCVPSTMQTLPDLFAKKGHATAGFSNNPWIGRLTGLHSRFDTYVESNLSVSQGTFQPKLPLSMRLTSLFGRRTARLRFQILLSYLQKRPVYTQTTLKMAQDWIGDQTKPFFCFINLMDAHQPFYPPREELKFFSGLDHNWYQMANMNMKFKDAFSGKSELDLNQKQLLNDYYDANLRHMDREIGKLFKLMERNDQMNRTMIVFTSDHGKILGEYPRSESISYMKDVNIHVPLIIYGLDDFPQGTVISENVELLFLFETLNRRFRLNAPDRYCMRTLQEAAKQRDSRAFAEASLPFIQKPGEMSYSAFCLRGERYKLIETDEGGVYLFDVIHDPLERENIAADKPQIVESMRSAIQEHLEGMKRNSTERQIDNNGMDDEVAERLRNLGYI